MNVVRNIERGLRLPRLATIRRLARELKLGGSESDELVRLAALAHTPPEAKEALSGPPVAGLVLWKHLPAALYSLPHGERGSLPPAADRVLPEVVCAGAALLGYYAASVSEPQPAILNALRTAADELAEVQPSLLYPPKMLAVQAVSARLVDRWHGLLFAAPRPVSKAIRVISRWDYSTGFSVHSDARLLFTYRDAPATYFPQEPARPAWLERAYNGLTLEALWTLLGFAARFHAGPDLAFYSIPDFKLTLKELEALDLATLPRRLDLPPGQVAPPGVAEYLYHWENAVALQRDGAFIAHLRAGPRFAEACLGPDWNDRLNRAAARAAELGEVLSAAARRRSAAAR